MREEGIIPNNYTFLAALKACSTIADLESGKEIHAHVIKSRQEIDLFVESTLVDMYAKCGSLVDARWVFENMKLRDVVSWNSMITGYAQMEMAQPALDLYVRMQHEGFKPDHRTFAAALKACGILATQTCEGIDAECSKMRCLEQGRTIHAEILKSGYESHTLVASTLVDMYAKCGSIELARKIFEGMRGRDMVSWNAIIMGYAQMEMGESAFELYIHMQLEGFIPDAYTYVAALKSCGSLKRQEDRVANGELLKIKSLKQCRAIHAKVAQSGLESDIFVANTLVDMYAKCGSIMDAFSVFRKMSKRNLLSWTSLVVGFTQMGMGESALELYDYMQREGFKPDGQTFVAAIKACGSLAIQEDGKALDGEILKLRSLEQGRAIHAEVARSGLESNIFIGNSLVDMYAKCGSMVDARQVFEKMRHHDVVSWTALITGYSQMGMGELALELYARMRDQGVTPNDRTFVAVLKACGSLAAQDEGKEFDNKILKLRCLERGRSIHKEITKGGFETDQFVANSLVDMYVKCGSIEDACCIFEKMRHRDVVSWNAMITGYVQMEMAEPALDLYMHMRHEGFEPDVRTYVAALKVYGILAAKEEGKEVDGKLLKIRCLEQGRAVHAELVRKAFEADVFIANTLVTMYAKCGSITDARQVFEKMAHRNVVSWNAMITGLAQMEMGKSALELYVCMQNEGFIPDGHTFVAALKACACLASLEIGQEIHAQINRAGLEREPFVASCLVDMYGKFGSMVDAQQLFDSLPERDAITWSALMTGYSTQGDSDYVLELYERMLQEGVKPVSITFLSVLIVCNHNGLMDKAQMYFRNMCLEYGIPPSSKHCMCMVDLFGRVDQLDEAVGLVKKMPYNPEMVTWMIILCACQKWNYVDTGRNVFECAVMLDGKCAAAYMSMANIYALAQMWEERAEIQEMRNSAQAWKKPGKYMWVDGTGTVLSFLEGKRNFQSKEIYAELENTNIKMKTESYV